MTVPRTGAEIREAFIGFFEERGHTRLASDSLIPSNDPTLLFTGAGMNQFKEEFLGRGRALKRATTSQKCLRVPDLENVGLTPRHHTFFEMLGNFSFGDYFKAETIPWEWEFFTEILGFDPDRFCATVYTDDEEAFQIWRDQIGLSPDRIYRFGEKENFWPSSAPSQGPNGPCGPCSELYYDQRPGEPLPDHDGLEDLPGRFLEVGNCVFTQFDRKDDGSLPALPQKNIDVGLGLERIVAVAQGASNNFETDLFAPALDTIQSLSGITYGQDSHSDIAMRRIADHSRAVFFCIADGAAPGREGRGYVVRKILRRAIRDGIQLDMPHDFFSCLLPCVQETMGAAYPELHEQQPTIQALCSAEEERFRDVYVNGIGRLDQSLETLRKEGVTLFPGEIAFELHDTFGFPVDITEVAVRAHGFEFDQAGFTAAMDAQKDRARAGSDLSGDVFCETLSQELLAQGVTSTEFSGHTTDRSETSLLAICQEGISAKSLQPGMAGELVLGVTPFYAEGGGQVGDSGQILMPDGSLAFEVTSTHQEGGLIFHVGQAISELQVGISVNAQISVDARRSSERHHTATHLLHAALKKVLGDHVSQAGSLVDPDRLRFDYTHPQAPMPEQLAAVEVLVNEQILRAQVVSKREESLDAARAAGVTALFGEKYGDTVRVVEVSGFSAELCGGTHVENTGQIGLLRILSDRALAAGVRRLEAVAGPVAFQSFKQDASRLTDLTQFLKAPAENLLDKVRSLQGQLKEASKKAGAQVPSVDVLHEEFRGDSCLSAQRLLGLDAKVLGRLGDGLKGREGLPPVVVLMGGEGDEFPFVILCDPNSGQKAGALAKIFGEFVQGGGGGRPDFAQGKGQNAGGIEDGLAALRNAIRSSA